MRDPCEQWDEHDRTVSGHHFATPSPADSRRRRWRLAHPSHALVDTPRAVHEARATAM